MNHHQSTSRPSHLLSTVSILIGALAFTPYIVLLVVIPIAHRLPSIIRTLLSVIGMWQFLLSSLVFGRPVSYALLCVGLLVLLATTFFVEPLNRRRRIGLGLSGLALLVFVFAPYRPPVTPIGEEEFLVLTEPSPWFRGLRNAQAIGELVPCRYDILGWHEPTLFYRAECNESVQVWEFMPGSSDKPVLRTKGVPDELYVQQYDRNVLLSHLYAPGIFPTSEEFTVRELFVPDWPLVSPDGVWLAFITRLPYSVEDVILIHLPEDKFAYISN